MLKKSGDIRQIFSDGQRYAGKHLHLYLLAAPEPAFAVLVTRRLGNAVERNRMKRLAREIYRRHQQHFEGWRVLFLIRKYRDSLGDLEEDVLRQIARIPRQQAINPL